jgi:hypothetical protein
LSTLRAGLAFFTVLVATLLALLWMLGREAPLVRAGQPLPTPVLSRIGGFGESSVAVFRGRPLLFVVLDSQCCAAQAAAAEKLSRELARRRLAVAVVFADRDRLRVDRFVRDVGLTIPVFEDPGRERLAPTFGSGQLPQYYLADREGQVVFSIVGDYDVRGTEFRAILEPLLSPAPW